MNRSIRRSAVPAAWYPHIPCTPPPGGVEAEQISTRGLGVVYGFQRATGRVKSCPRSATPPVIAPPR